uniref:Uncharacterized protein n=1 Tax=Arundo donax TaxID=35708 RepID=A0A0A9I0A1_ARUDO
MTSLRCQQNSSKFPPKLLGSAFSLLTSPSSQRSFSSAINFILKIDLCVQHKILFHILFLNHGLRSRSCQDLCKTQGHKY